MDKCYCVFGDSVTQAPYVSVCWVDLLRGYLEEKYTQDYIHVFNLGISGNTTENILGRFESESQVRLPTSLIFAVGINDSKLDDEDQFTRNLMKIVEKARVFCNDIMFVGVVLGNWTEDDDFSQEAALRYNEILKQSAASTGSKFVDLLSILTPEDFIDGLHPNDQGHKKMFEVIKTYF